MNCRTRYTVLAIALVLFVLKGRAQERLIPLHLKLNRAIELALSENPTIKVAKQEIRLKVVANKEAWQSLLPTLNATGSVAYTIIAPEFNLGGKGMKMGKDNTNTTTGVINLSLPVFAPAVYRTMKMTQTDIKLALEKSRASRLDMVNQVTKAYYQLMLAQDSYQVLLENYQQTERNYNIVKAKYEQGSVSEYDKVSAEVQFRNAWPNVVSGKNAVSLAKLQLKVLMGVTAEVDPIIDDKLTNYETEMSIPTETASKLSFEGNTTLKQFDINGELLHRTRNILKANLLPSLSLSGNYQYQSMNNKSFQFYNYNWTNGSSVTLSLNIPIFQASNFTKLKTNQIQQYQLAENRVNTERQLHMQAQSYLNNMTSSSEQLTSNKQAVELAKKEVGISEKRYEVGKGTILELNSSQVSLTSTQLTYNNSIYDYLVAKTDLGNVLGTKNF